MASASAPLASTLDPPLTAKEELELLVASSLSRCFGKDVASNPGPCIAVPPRLDLGDFQSNAAMPLAKRLGRAPRDVAETLQKDLVAHGALSFVSNISLAGDYLEIFVKPRFIFTHTPFSYLP
jgi:arginyl-tRNA synthetase